MCGYCIEKNMFDLLGQEVISGAPAQMDQDDAMIIEPYAQETNFLMHTLKYARNLEMEQEVLYILHCRALEEIAVRPDSAMKSSLPQMTLVKHYHAYQNFIRSRFNPSVIKNRLPCSSLAFLYSPEFVFAHDKWSGFLFHENLLQQCSELLHFYHSWWLVGQDQEKNDLNKRMEETGVCDPIEDISDEEWDRFYDLFPAVYFALVYAGQYGQDLSLIEKIALTHPNGVPHFPGFDLWIARKAYMIVLQKKGVSFVFENMNFEFRPSLAYYGFLKLEWMRQNKEELISRMTSWAESQEMLTEHVLYAREFAEEMQTFPKLDLKYQ